MQDIQWKDLETRGFVHARSFLSPEEIERVIADYTLHAPTSESRSYYTKFPTPAVTELLGPKLRAVAAHVRAATAVRVDMTIGAAYFATVPPEPMKPQAFGWHQDHDDWFAFQDHFHCLNFYLPVVKPERARSNLTVLPFDAVAAASPAACAHILRAGARQYFPTADGTTEFSDDGTDRRGVLDVDIDTLAETPLLEAGDLLLSRGDIVHKTQDAETDRVAIKIIMMAADGAITRQQLRAGGVTKYSWLLANLEFYASVLGCFTAHRRDAITVAELTAFLDDTFHAAKRAGTALPPVSVPDFLETLTRSAP